MNYSISYFKDLSDISNIVSSQSVEDIENQEAAFTLASDYSKKGNNVIIFEGNVIYDTFNTKFVAMYEPLDSDMFENLKDILLNYTL